MRLYEAFTGKGQGPLTDRDATAHVWTSMSMGHSARIQNVRSYPTNLQQIRPEHDFLNMRLYEAFTRKGQGPLTDRDATAHVWTSMYMGHSARIQNVRSYPTNLQQIRPEHDFLKPGTTHRQRCHRTCVDFHVHGS